jgi:hypothetical protein
MKRRPLTRYEAAAADLLDEHGVRVRAIVASGHGEAHGDGSISAPAPVNAAGFAGVAHEVAHVGQAADEHRPSEWVRELAAWRFALRIGSERGLPGKRQAVEHAASCLESYGPGLGRLTLRRLLTEPHIKLTVTHERVD